MFVCPNCKQFVTTVLTCDCCKRDVCDKCILIGDEPHTSPNYNSYEKICSKCVCTGCIKGGMPYEFSIGYDKCKTCDLKYCGKCFNESKCYESNHTK